MLDDLIPGLMMILITSSLDLICQSETILMHTILFGNVVHSKFTTGI
jgi:hypothetical protein